MPDRKTVLVTGGSHGIGKSIALAMADRGWDVAVTYRQREEGAFDTCRKAVEKGAVSRRYYLDLNDLTMPEKVVDAVRADFGRLDAVVCNAAKDIRYSILLATADRLVADMSQLYAAQMLLAGAAARRFVRDKVQGCILFNTSVHGQMPVASDFLYGGMKAAIERSCKSLALELSPYRIRVNCVAPGAINSGHRDDSALKYHYYDMVPLGRWGVEEDIAAAAAFLLSDEAFYITGQTLTIDGGFSLPGMPEGYAPAYPVDEGFIRRSYEQMLQNEEAKKDNV